METYQSRYSAEDLDNTIGLVHGLVVPHVGDNGNWFVGETDTGVFAKGIDVTGAQVGQVVEVSEVDENGRPIAWEPVDPKSGIKKMRLVASIDIDQTDLPSTIEITEDMDGNPFSLREFVIDDDITSNVSYKIPAFNGVGDANYLRLYNGRTTVLYHAGDNYISYLGNGLYAGSMLVHNKSGFHGPVTSIRYPVTYTLTKGTFLRVYEIYE